MKALVLGVLSFAVILIAWEAAARLDWVNPFFTSQPTAIATALAEQSRTGELAGNLGVSLREFGVGFGAAVAFGLVLGTLAGWFKPVGYVVAPFLWFVYSAPLIAFYPLFVLWLGLGPRTVMVIAFLLSVTPVAVNTMAGIEHVDRMLLVAARAFGARSRDLLWKVALPASVPMIVAGLRLGVGRALTGVVIAELFVPSGGLGSSIAYYGALLKTTNMLASLMVIVALGVVCTQALSVVESRLDSWRTGPGCDHVARGAMPLTVAVDIGGTFTDLLGCDPGTGRLVGSKRPTTPAAMTEGVWDCLQAAGVGGADLAAFVHGSTIAINTIIERSGARTALVVTRGTRDVYAIGRGNRPDAYDVWFHRPRPLVPRHLTFEVDERIDAGGRVLTPFDRVQAARVAADVAASGVHAVAVCFLHSWREPSHERLMGELLREALPGAFVTVSHEILREYGEYERTSTTVLNAYVGPRVGDYLDTLERRLDASHFRGDLLIMQSNGGVMAASTARALPIATLESGPVGGFTAAARTAERLGCRRAIAFDMGGTTAKANLILDGQPQMARGYHIGGYATGQPMTLPVVDTVEVGAGGGSLARALAGGGLEVGPESAGADPGPACYGKGGALATVTDANVVLGRIDPHAFLGGEITLDADAARVAVGHVAERLGLTLPDAALAIVQVAVLKMSLAVRQVSVERGYDPRDFAMVAFGGAGPLHASDVARALHVPVVVVPLYPGQFSAAGMLLADRRHDYVRTCDRPFDLNDAADLAGLHAIASDLEVTARARLGSERSGAAPAAMSFSLDVRYAGQDFSLAVPLENSFFSHRDGEAVKARFGELHQRSFGYHEPGHALEVVTVRLAAVSPRPLDRPFEFSVASETPGSAVSRPVWFEARQPVECPVYRRDTLPPGRLCSGPAIVQEYASTTLLAPGDRMQVTPSGDLVIQLRAD